MMIGLLLILMLQTPDSIISRVGIDQKLGDRIDAGITLHAEDGSDIRLGDLFGKRPILLTPVYYECPMLCSRQLNALSGAMKLMSFSAGQEFDVVTFSFNPAETPQLASAKKEQYMKDYGRSGAGKGWHFLTGDAESIRRLTEEIGFRYAYDPASAQYAHATTLLTLTPDGRISKYFNGIEYDPADLKYSLIDASDGKIGSFIDHAILYCYQYDPATGKYGLAIMRVLRIAGILTVLALASFMLLASRMRTRRGPRDLPARMERG